MNNQPTILPPFLIPQASLTARFYRALIPHKTMLTSLQPHQFHIIIFLIGFLAGILLTIAAILIARLFISNENS